MDDRKHNSDDSKNEKNVSKVNFKEKIKVEVAPNWSADETTLLNDLCSQKSHVLDAKFDSNVTKAKKAMLWEEIAVKIRALNVYPRTAIQCRKRWQNEKTRASKKIRNWVASSRKTGKYFFISIFVSMSELSNVDIQNH